MEIHAKEWSGIGIMSLLATSQHMRMVLQLSGTKINKIQSSPTARKRVLLSLHFHVSYSLFQSLILFLILVATQTEVTTEDTAVVMQTDAASVTKSVNTVTEETATPPIVIASNKSTSCQNQVCEITLQLQQSSQCTLMALFLT